VATLAKTADRKPRSKASKDLGPSVRAHIKYKLADGTNVPGVTTITGQYNKPFLVGWANRLGLEGTDSMKYTEQAQKIGSAAHHMIESKLRNEEPRLREFTQEQIERAMYGFSEFERWQSEHIVEPILTETPFISERLKYGGTLDLYAKVDGTPNLVDFKTSADLYPEHGWQIGGLWNLLRENGYAVGGARILRIGRSEEEGFGDNVMNGVQVTNAFKVFRSLLGVYWAIKEART
jgi:hypothetical protein